MAKFKQEVLETMKTDPDLFSALAKELGIKPTSLPITIDRNGATLNQYSIVTLVATHLGKDPDDLLEKNTEDIKEESTNGS
jgi:hypothetical protein